MSNFITITKNNLVDWEEVKLELRNFIKKFIEEDGKIINARSSKGENVLLKVLDSDEGSRRLGEVALVPNSSPISQLEITFYNTLFDENAASHIALGQCYSKCFKSKKDLSYSSAATIEYSSPLIIIFESI